jgi:hypothetical protein
MNLIEEIQKTRNKLERKADCLNQVVGAYAIGEF